MGGFSEEERKWIVLNFREDIGVTQLRRSFMTKMRPKSPRTKPSLQCFKKILEKFKETGSVQDLRKGNHRPTLSGDTVNKVKTHFESNPNSSIRKASNDIGLSYSSIQKTLKKTLRMKPYKRSHVQTLTGEHRLKRLQACKKFQEQGKDWPRKVVFSDEKWFCLKPHPNRKNNVTWSVTNPNEVVEVRDQGVAKVMAWVGIVNGRLLPIHWFAGSVDGNQYLNMLKDKVWPALKRYSTKEQIWFMQDGARPHTTNDCLEFLQLKFQNRVISNRLDFFWPPKSPDLNPLDFYFWGEAEKAVYDAKPKNIEDLKQTVEDFARSVSRETLLAVADNFYKRSKLCLEEKGGHFEHKLKKIKK